MSIPPLLDTFSATDAPDPGLISTCIHCGMCLPECPTYRVLRVETDSPRGRIELVRAVHEGRLGLAEPSFSKHIFQCLDCRGCESACPSGVEYGPIVEAARAQATQSGNLPRGMAGANFLLRNILGRYWLMRRPERGFCGWCNRPAWTDWPNALGCSGFCRTAWPTPLARPREFLRISAGLPMLRWCRPQGRPRYRVAMLAGCIMQVAFADVNAATIRVLTASGCEVHLPRDQGLLRWSELAQWRPRNRPSIGGPQCGCLRR